MATPINLRNDSCSGIMGSHYHTYAIGTVQKKIQDAMPAHAVISSIKIRVRTYHTWTNILGNNAKIYIEAWFSPDELTKYNTGTRLMDAQRVTNDKTWATYESGNIVKHFQTTYPYTINTSYPVLTIYYDTANTISRTYYHDINLDIEYSVNDHTYKSTVTTAAKCTTAGETTYTCDCGHSYVDKTKPVALGHGWGTTTYTWSSDGKTCTAKRVCGRSGCGTTETATATITSAVKTAATCTAKGTTRYTATFGVSWATTQTKDVQNIPAKEHTAGSTVVENRVEATCTTDGSYDNVVYCKECGVELSRNTVIVPATGHNPSCYPEITSVQLIYQNKQVSGNNKVPAEEYFRIVVGAIAHH